MYAKSEKLLAAISSVVIELSDENEIIRWNPTAESVFGISKLDAVGERIESLDIDWQNKKQITSFLNSTESQQTDDDSTSDLQSTKIETEFHDRERNQRIIGFTKFPVFEDSIFVGTLILGSDLTVQKQLEQQLQSSQKLEAVGQLAAGVAHEINTPIQYLGDNVRYVRKSFDKILQIVDAYQRIMQAANEGKLQGIPEDAIVDIKPRKLKSLVTQIPEALDDSEEGIEHISRIVRAMKQFSHPGEDAKTAVKLNDALATTLTVTANEWKYVAEIETDFDEQLDEVMGFPGELNQVFMNLIVNAAHAIEEKVGVDNSEKGSIKITTRATPEYAEVQIADSGNGIPVQARSRVFDQFFTTKEVGKGTGQGLSIAHQVVVKKHQGLISFESELGVGTTFTIQLPFASESQTESDSSTDSEAESICELTTN